MSDVLAGPRADARRSAWVARRNPVAKLAVALLLSVTLVLSVDPVTAGVALALEALVLPVCGVTLAGLWRRGWPVVVGGVSAGVAATWLGVDSGAVLLALGPVTVSQGSLEGGLAIGLRVLALGLPGVVLLATTDPTDLADALAQRLHLPARFVLGALAGLRLFGVLAEELAALRAARRARGLGGDGVLGAVRTASGLVFALLVLSVRRATVLATAMEARGFGVAPERTWARESVLGWSDLLLVTGGVVLAGVSTAAGVAAGTWRLVVL